MDDEDNLCQVICGIDMIEEWTEKNASLKTGEVSTGYLTMRMRLSLLSGYRIDVSLDTTPAMLQIKRDQLLQHLQLPLSEFMENGVYTARLNDCLAKLPFQELRSLKHQIWEVLLARKAEF